MSTFKYDFERPASDIYYMRKDPTIKAATPQSVDKIDIKEFLTALRQFSHSFSEEDNTRYQQARIVAKTTSNNKDISHIWNVISSFFLESVKQTYPDMDFTKLSDKLRELNFSDLSKKDVDNRVFAVYLVGILEGLL